MRLPYGLLWFNIGRRGSTDWIAAGGYGVLPEATGSGVSSHRCFIERGSLIHDWRLVEPW
jgi:hypothetical protein